MKNAPCKDCADRFVGCHAACERYRAFKAETDRVRNAKQADEALRDSIRIKRRKRRRF